MQIYYALAYLDPGTGSLVIQAVVGSVLGGLLLIKVYWRKILAFLTNRKPTAAPTGTQPSTQTDQKTE